MIDFSRPLLLFLIMPWAAFTVYFFIIQRRALGKLGENVSGRFLGRMTLYNGTGLFLHALAIFIMGSLLAISSAEPRVPGGGGGDIRGDTVIFMIDSSLSMVAADANEIPGLGKAKNRMNEACDIARAVMRGLPGYQFGLISFSGVAAYNSPPTADLSALEGYLKGLRLHVYQKMGTNFRAPLEALIHLAQYSSNRGFQGVMISDGEAMEEEGYDGELEILVKKGIAVHTIGVGTKKGSGIVIYDPRDVQEGKRTPKKIRDVRTGRADGHLKKIAGTTSGRYAVPEKKDTIESVIEAIKKNPGAKNPTGGSGKRDISHYFIFAFALMFFSDIIFFDGLLFWKEAIHSWKNRFRGGV